MRHIVAIPIIAGLSCLGLAGCTTDQEAQSLAAITTACTALGVGSQIAINVTSGGSAAAVTSVIGQDVTTSCQLAVTGAQNIINQITSAGQTATATVTTTAPAATTTSMRGRHVMRFTARRDAATGQMVYVFPPSGLFGF